MHIAELDINQLQHNAIFRDLLARSRHLSSEVSRGKVLRLDYQMNLDAKAEELRRAQAKIKELENNLAHKDRLLKNKERRNAELKDAIDGLTKTTIDQTKTISRLAGMLFKFTGKAAGISPRKRGGQVGHKGSGRRTTTGDDGEPLPPDEIVRCFLTNCPDCGSPVSRTSSCQSHTIVDIPKLTELLAQTVQYDIEQQWCGNCHVRVMATVPQVLPHAKVGLNTIILVLIYRYTCHIPLAKIRYLLKTCYQLDLTEGAVQNILDRAKDWFAGQYNQLLVMLRAARIKHADETGWKIGRIRAWIWGFFTKQLAYYVASPSRGGAVPAKVLFDVDKVEDLPTEIDLLQLLIRDDYRGYWKLPLLQQSCWSHLLRFAWEEYQSAPKKAEICRLRTILKTLYRKLAKALTQSDARRSKVYDYAWGVLQQIIQATFATDQAKAVRTRITNQGRSLLTALKFEGAELTNNYAERNIRPLAVARKISGGSRSNEGAEILAVNASIVQTIRIQNKDMVTTLANIITGQPSGLFTQN